MNTKNTHITKYKNGNHTVTSDLIVREEPLEIFVNDVPFTTTMRLPGEEIPLAVGICFTEGVIRSSEDLLTVNYCKDMSSNRIIVYTKRMCSSNASQTFKQKRFISYSSCGLCGKDMIADIVSTVQKSTKTVSITGTQLAACRDIVASNQKTFHLTGGTHAAGVFDKDGYLLAISEDIGRHNALDKTVGKVLLAHKQKEAAIIILTSRLSFEMVQKAAQLGAEILAGISSTTTATVELANNCNMTLVGFLRGNGGNIYTHPERLFEIKTG